MTMCYSVFRLSVHNYQKITKSGGEAHSLAHWPLLIVNRPLMSRVEMAD